MCIRDRPFNAPVQYAREIANLANLISGGSVLVQRFGDLVRGRRTEEKRLAQSTTRPTLEAVPGDLSPVSYTHLDVYKRQPLR